MKVYDNILTSSQQKGRSIYFINPKTIYEFFALGNKSLKIPDYQRPYSWSKENVMALIKDVEKLIDNENGSWFLGPLFTAKLTGEDDIVDLLDGQQRVTTIQIILREFYFVDYYFPNFDWENNPDLKNSITKLKKNIFKCLIDDSDPIIDKPRFKPEESLIKLFNEYISSINELNNIEELLNYNSKFKKSLKTENNNGSKTAGRMHDVINLVSKHLKDQYLTKTEEKKTSLSNYINFVNALISKCWLIEIPLLHDDNSIQIFESINNRGKSLTLLDKLRYKSLIYSSNTNNEEIKRNWKNIYLGLENLEDWSFIKGDDDFFKVYFNSINGDDFTKEEDFLNLYLNHFLKKGDSGIDCFLKEVQKIIDFYTYLAKALDSDNYFIENNFPDRKRQVKVRALFRLLRVSMKNSANGRLLLFNLIRNYEFEENHEIIVQGIWTIIRVIFYEEIYSNKRSNKIRNSFMFLVKCLEGKGEQIEKDEEGKDKKVKIKKLQFQEILYNTGKLENYDFNMNGNQKNLFITTDNNESKFILYLYSYLFNHNSLVARSSSVVKFDELEHFFPTSWKDYWLDKNFSRTDVISALENKQLSDNFKYINFETLINEVKILGEKISLDSHTSSKDLRNNESLLQFIGNKWVAHDSSNIRASNKDFKFKKEKYSEDNFSMVPGNGDKIGLSQYDDFSYLEIIDRSLYIVEKILDRFLNKWDDID